MAAGGALERAEASIPAATAATSAAPQANAAQGAVSVVKTSHSVIQVTELARAAASNVHGSTASDPLDSAGSASDFAACAAVSASASVSSSPGRTAIAPGVAERCRTRRTEIHVMNSPVSSTVAANETVRG